LFSFPSPPGHDGKPHVDGKWICCYESDGFSSKFTIPDAGQAKWGGWKAIGLLMYKEFRDGNKAARLTDESKAMEAAILAYIRNEKGITAPNPADNIKSKRRRLNPELAEIQAIEIVDDDEE